MKVLQFEQKFSIAGADHFKTKILTVFCTIHCIMNCVFTLNSEIDSNTGKKKCQKRIELSGEKSSLQYRFVAVMVKTSRNWMILCKLPGGKRFQPVGGRKRPEPKACLEPIYISHLTTKSKARLVPVPGYLGPGRSRAMISVP